MNSEGAERGNVLGYLAGAGRYVCLVACVAACNLDNPGVKLPRGELAYPIAVELSRETNDDGAPRFLYVANANFDLRFNAGSVHAYDLDALGERLAADRCRCDEETDDCRSRGLAEVDISEPLPVEAGVVGVRDAGASEDADLDAAAEPIPPDGDAAIAEDAEITEDAEVEDASEPAGDAEADAATDEVVLPAGYDAPAQYGTALGILCDGRDDADDTVCCLGDRAALDPLRTSEFLIDSYANGMALSPAGDRLYVPIRSRDRLVYLDVADGELSCGSTDEDGRCKRGPDRGSEGVSGDMGAPQASATITGELSQLGFVDRNETFIATSHEYGQLSLYLDSGRGPVLQDVLTSTVQRALSLTLDPTRQLLLMNAVAARAVDQVAVVERDGKLVLARSDALAVPDISPATDVRGLIVDDQVPGRLIALVRGPSTSQQQAIVFFDLDAVDGAKLVSAVRVGAGPVKLTLAELNGRRYLFAACYDGRAIYVVDADTHELVSVVRELNGPYDMAIDSVRGLMYVADFRSSVLRVVDVRGIGDRTRPPPRIVATLGKLYFGGSLK